MKYARIDNDVVAEIIDFSPVGKFVSAMIWIECDDTVLVGMDYSEGEFTMSDQFKLDNYAELRKHTYPSIGDQLDMQYHDNLNGTTTWDDAIAAVKLLYPKPIID